MKSLALLFLLSVGAGAQVINPPTAGACANCLVNNAGNTISTGDQNFSAATSFELPALTTAVNATTAIKVQGGLDTTTPGTLGGITVQGGSLSGATAGGSTGGAILLVGGDNLSTSATNNQLSGDAQFGSGLVGTGNNPVPGMNVFTQSGRRDATYHGYSGGVSGGALGCNVGHDTWGDCASVATNPNYAGILLDLRNTGNGAEVQITGDVNALSNTSAGVTTTWTEGHTICTSAAIAGVMVDNGFAACPCPQVQVGIARLTDGIASNAHRMFIKPGGCLQPSIATPTVNTATNDDVICESTNVGSYTCTGVSTTETFFATKVIVPAAATASLIDGLHHGIHLGATFDSTAPAANANATYRLYACSSLSGQTCSNSKVLWTSATQTLGANITTAGRKIECDVLTGSTATTLVAACQGNLVTGAASTGTSITTATTNSGANWVLALSIQYVTNGSVEAVALTSMYGIPIP